MRYYIRNRFSLIKHLINTNYQMFFGAIVVWQKRRVGGLESRIPGSQIYRLHESLCCQYTHCTIQVYVLSSMGFFLCIDLFPTEKAQVELKKNRSFIIIISATSGMYQYWPSNPYTSIPIYFVFLILVYMVHCLQIVYMYR